MMPIPTLSVIPDPFLSGSMTVFLGPLPLLALVATVVVFLVLLLGMWQDTAMRAASRARGDGGKAVYPLQPTTIMQVSPPQRAA